MAHLTWYLICFMTFHTVLDIVWLILLLLAARTIRGTRWQMHLRWLNPYIINSLLDFVFRMIDDLLNLRILPRDRFWYALAETSVTLGEVIGLYATYLLLKTFRLLVSEQPKSEPKAAFQEEGVWPPPPTNVA